MFYSGLWNKTHNWLRTVPGGGKKKVVIFFLIGALAFIHFGMIRDEEPINILFSWIQLCDGPIKNTRLHHFIEEFFYISTLLMSPAFARMRLWIAFIKLRIRNELN